MEPFGPSASRPTRSQQNSHASEPIMIQQSNSSSPTRPDYIVDIKRGVLSFRSLLPGPPGLMPAVFLDRDGVVNRHTPGEYVTRWAEFKILPGVPNALRRLRRAGFRLVI